MNRPEIELSRDGVLGVCACSIAALASLVGAGFGLPVQQNVQDAGVTTLAVIVSLTLVLVVPTVYTVFARGDALNPLVLLTGTIFLYYPLPAFFNAYFNIGYTIPSFATGLRTLLPSMVKSLVLMLLAVLGLYLGYAALVLTERTFGIFEGVFAGVERATSRYAIPLPLHVVLSVWFGSLLLYRFQLAGLASRNLVVGNLALLHAYLVPVVTAAIFGGRDDVGIYKLGYVGFLLVELLAISVGQIELDMVLIVVVGTLVSFHYYVRRLSVRDMALAGLGVVALFPIAEVIEWLQDKSVGLNQAAARNSESAFLGIVDAFVGRMIGSQSFTVVVDKVPEQVAFAGGRTLALVPLSIVPRAVWNGKPAISLCIYMNRHFAGREPWEPTCTAMTVFAEFYWNFGMAGVVAGSFVFGAVTAAVYVAWSRLKDTNLRQFALVSYTIILVNVLRIEAGAAQIFSGIFKRSLFLVTAFLLVSVCYWTSRRLRTRVGYGSA